jgi:hypothetical protein
MGGDGSDCEGSSRPTEVALMPLSQIGSPSPVGSGLLAGWSSSSVVFRRLSNLAAVLDWKAA